MKTAFEGLESPYLDGELEFVIPAKELSNNLAQAIGKSPFANLTPVSNPLDEPSAAEVFETLLEQEVIGTDERTLVANALAVPNRWVCAIDLLIADPKLGKGVPLIMRDSRGTGILIGPRHVLTAKHVLAPVKVRVDNQDVEAPIASVRVSPARHGDNTSHPLGKASSKAIYRSRLHLIKQRKTVAVPDGSSRVVDLKIMWDDDYALIILDQDLSGRTHKKMNGPLGYWGQTPSQAAVRQLDPKTVQGREVTVIGYPGDRCGKEVITGSSADKERLINRCVRNRRDEWASTQWRSKGKVNVDPTTSRIEHTADTYKGESGAPICLRNGDVLDLLGVHVDQNPPGIGQPVTSNLGVLVTLHMLREICSWMNADAASQIATIKDDTLIVQPRIKEAKEALEIDKSAIRKDFEGEEEFETDESAAEERFEVTYDSPGGFSREAEGSYEFEDEPEDEDFDGETDAEVEEEQEEREAAPEWFEHEQPQKARPEIILVAGANYPKFEQSGSVWKRKRHLSAGPWRGFGLTLAEDRLKANPNLKVTLFDLLLGTRENVTLNANKEAVTTVEQSLTAPIADDYWNLLGIDLSRPDPTQVPGATLEPANKKVLTKKPQINYFDGASALFKGKSSVKLLDYLSAVSKVVSPVISITDVYAYIEGFAGSGKKSALIELHFLAHAFNIMTTNYSGGPILLNSLDNPFSPDRHPLDKDARAAKDFQKPTMDPAVFSQAFGTDAKSFIWGCNFQRGFIRQFVHQVAKNEKTLAGGGIMNISHNSDWGSDAEFRTRLGLGAELLDQECQRESRQDRADLEGHESGDVHAKACHGLRAPGSRRSSRHLCGLRRERQPATAVARSHERRPLPKRHGQFRARVALLPGPPQVRL